MIIINYRLQYYYYSALRAVYLSDIVQNNIKKAVLLGTAFLFNRYTDHGKTPSVLYD